MRFELRQGNVFDELPKLANESVDLVLTSPPYCGNEYAEKPLVFA